MKKEKTIEAIGRYCETIKVPNWESRLKTKSDDYLFDIGVLVTSPANRGKDFDDLREQMNHLLNFENLDDATEDMKRKIEQVKNDMPDVIKELIDKLQDKMPGKVSVHIVDLSKGDMFQTEQSSLKKSLQLKIEQAKKLSAIEKISKLLSIGLKIGLDVKGSAYYDRLDDLNLHNPDYLNLCYATIVDMMEIQGDHYKTCDCIRKKYDVIVFSNNEMELAKKIMHF